MGLIHDKAIILIANQNTVKSVALSGSGQQSIYQSIHASKLHNYLQVNTRNVLCNAIPGHLQMINVDKGLPNTVWDICNRNYVSEQQTIDVTNV